MLIFITAYTLFPRILFYRTAESEIIDKGEKRVILKIRFKDPVLRHLVSEINLYLCTNKTIER